MSFSTVTNNLMYYKRTTNTISIFALCNFRAVRSCGLVKFYFTFQLFQRYNLTEKKRVLFCFLELLVINIVVLDALKK